MSDIAETNNKPTVLAVGLFVFGFSFTRVFEFLFEHLSSTYHICWLGIGYKGEVKQYRHFTLYPANVKGGDVYGAAGAAELAVKLNAQSIFLINDFFMLKNYEAEWVHLKKMGIRLVAYVPMDGSFINCDEAGHCLFLDYLVLYHYDAKTDVKNTIEKYKTMYGISESVYPKLKVCYHGVDQTLFRSPVSKMQKKMLKQKLFMTPNSEDSLFILNANRYNERKNIEATIDGFAKAKSLFKKPVFLVLHTPNLNEIKTKELKLKIANSPFSENILLNPLGDSYCDDNQLIEMYQACDIGVNTSFGEGWGLISFEHAACGAAQIVPDHTCPGQVWKEVGIITPVTYTKVLDTNPFLMYGVDVEKLGHQMAMLVNDHELLEVVSQRCQLHSQQKAFHWEEIAQKWKKILGDG